MVQLSHPYMTIGKNIALTRRTFVGKITSLLVASAYKGVRICRQTQGVWENEWKCCPHPRGGEYYWLTGNYRITETGMTDSDHWALENGYIAITPVQIDMTAYGVMEELKSWNL